MGAYSGTRCGSERQMAERRKRDASRNGIVALHRALDEARFGRERTLNLRATLPRPKEAEARCEAWLRERQVAKSGELLVITGRGVNSWDGESVVREAIVRLLASLRRRGVVDAWYEHTPGSFVVRPTVKTGMPCEISWFVIWVRPSLFVGSIERQSI